MPTATRTELWGRLGRIRVVEPATQSAFDFFEEREWREDRNNSPHGNHWHTSFHASSFPGDDERGCARREQYVLMNAARNEATPRKLRGQGEVGKAVELMLVERWGAFGLLLTNDQTAGDEFQTGFEDEDFWLTGNCDAIILPSGWRKPHVVEVKTKAHDVVLQMKRGERGPDAKHIRQCKTYIGLAHEEADRWPGFDPCTTGSIFYLSRDDPSFTAEFIYSYDARFMEVGRRRLGEAREAFKRGELLPHPFGGRQWSIEPCKYCDFKKHCCKPDDIADVTRLRESNALAWTAEVRGEYDYDATKKAVLDRWGAEDMEEETA